MYPNENLRNRRRQRTNENLERAHIENFDNNILT